MKRVALSGGIGTGKSTVLSLLNEWSVPTIDADAIVHTLYDQDAELITAIHRLVEKTLPQDNYNLASVLTPNGGINRAALAPLLFNNPVLRQQIEAVVHPKVRQSIQDFFTQQAQAGKPLAVAEIPVLFEASSLEEIAKLYDSVWLVTASPQQQLLRLQDARKLSAQEAQTRLACQLPMAQKVLWTKQLGGHVIENTGELEQTRQQLLQVVQTTAR